MKKILVYQIFKTGDRTNVFPFPKVSPTEMVERKDFDNLVKKYSELESEYWELRNKYSYMSCRKTLFGYIMKIIKKARR